jgi:hypothetical protein
MTGKIKQETMILAGNHLQAHRKQIPKVGSVRKQALQHKYDEQNE